MLLIGLTGGIGSGKSTALRVFKKLGAHVIDADALARKAVEPGKPAWRDIKQRFGAAVFHKNGRLDRKKLAARVFNNKKALKELNAIVHPRVKAMEAELINGIKKSDKNAVIVVDAPMMIEAGFHRSKDVLVVMDSTEENQVKRTVKSGRLNRRQAKARIRAQMPAAQKKKFADYVIENSGTLAECRKNAQAVYRVILKERGPRAS
jgi:dephospho-CoA kinase